MAYDPSAHKAQVINCSEGPKYNLDLRTFGPREQGRVNCPEVPNDHLAAKKGEKTTSDLVISAARKFHLVSK